MKLYVGNLPYDASVDDRARLPEHNYVYRARAFNFAGVGPASDPVSLGTWSTVPRAPTNVGASFDGTGPLRATWHDESAREDAPLAAIERIRAVIAEDEEASRRDDLRRDRSGRRRCDDVRLCGCVSGDEQPAVVRFYEITGQSDDALYQQIAGARGRVKNDDVSALRTPAVVWRHDDVIAGLQRRFHRA